MEGEEMQGSFSPVLIGYTVHEPVWIQKDADPN
jgi:hypothetical protein